MPNVTAIITAYNEDATVGGVVRAVRESGLAERIIVVSDGSTDGTTEAARHEADLVVATAYNQGKGGALRLGVGYTDAPILLFLDADMIGLENGHLRAVVEPVMSGRVSMNVGIVGRGTLYTWLARRLPKISGQRAVRREVFAAMSESESRGFGVETAMNNACRRIGAQSDSVVLRGLNFRKKYEKVGWLSAFREYLRMFWQIGRAAVAGWADAFKSKSP